MHSNGARRLHARLVDGAERDANAEALSGRNGPSWHATDALAMAVTRAGAMGRAGRPILTSSQSGC